MSATEWQYAFAPMTCWALKAEHKGQPVWSLPLRSTDDPSKPFFDRTDRPQANAAADAAELTRLRSFPAQLPDEAAKP